MCSSSTDFEQPVGEQPTLWKSGDVIDCAFYSRGERRPGEGMTLEEAASCPRRGNNFVWIELHNPTREAMAEVRRHFGLHELAVEDAAHAHQRPKVEPYDDFYFIVYKAARYDVPTNRVIFGELDLFRGRDRRPARRGRPGPAAAVWAILDSVVDDYNPVLAGLERDIEEAERATFAGAEDVTEQLYLFKTELNEVYRAVHPCSRRSTR